MKKAIIILAMVLMSTAAIYADVSSHYTVKKQTKEELLEMFNRMPPQELAAYVHEVLATKDDELISTAWKAYSEFFLAQDSFVQNLYIKAMSRENPLFVVSPYGAFTFSANGMSAFTAGNNSSAANSILIDSGVDVPAIKSYSADSSL